MTTAASASNLSRTDGVRRMLEVVRRLRGEGGCPWDREQTLETLKPFLVEETYELLDALDSGDTDRHRDELGDVLLQVVLQAQIRREGGCFDFDDVANGLADKLIRRHPHVFGDVQAETSGEVLRNWEAIKATEGKVDGKPRSTLAGIPKHLPALSKAQKTQVRAARVGFDWSDVKDVVAKIEEELDETKSALAAKDADNVREEIGDLLFAVVNLCRFQGVEAEEALNATVSKFMRRFQEIEHRVHESGRQMSDCTLHEMDVMWEDVKREERR
jgi:MazG family protein